MATSSSDRAASNAANRSGERRPTVTTGSGVVPFSPSPVAKRRGTLDSVDDRTALVGSEAIEPCRKLA